MLHKILIHRLVIFNLIGAVVLGWGAYLGIPQYLNAGDSTHVVWIEAGLFLVGLVSLFWRAFALRKAHRTGVLPDYKTFVEKNAHLGDVSDWLVILGLVGSVIGLSLTMGGIDVTAIGSPQGAVAVISHLLDHMSIAFNTTIVGGALGLWIAVNFRMLKTATVTLFEETTPK